MATATLSKHGRIVIPAEVRTRHGLTTGTRVEVLDEGGVVRLVVHRRAPPSDPAAGYGLVKIPPSCSGQRRLADVDPALWAARKKAG